MNKLKDTSNWVAPTLLNQKKINSDHADEKVYEKGYNDGYNNGVKDAQDNNNSDNILSQINSTIEKIQNEVTEREYSDVIKFIHEKIEKLTYYQYKNNDIFLKKLNSITANPEFNNKKITIYISPDDYNKINEAKISFNENTALQADNSLQNGDCKIQHDYKSYSSTIKDLVNKIFSDEL